MAVDDFKNAINSSVENAINKALGSTGGGGAGSGSGTGGGALKKPSLIGTFNTLEAAENTLVKAYQRYARFIDEVPTTYADYIKKVSATVSKRRSQLEQMLRLKPGALQGASFTESSVATQAFEKEYKRLGTSIGKLQALVSPGPEEQAELRQLTERRTHLAATAKNMLGANLEQTTKPDVLNAFNGLKSAESTLAEAYQNYARFVGNIPDEYANYVKRVANTVTERRAQIEKMLHMAPGTLPKESFSETSAATQAYTQEHDRLNKAIDSLQTMGPFGPEKPNASRQLEELIARRQRLEESAYRTVGLQLAPKTPPDRMRWERFAGALKTQETTASRLNELQNIASRFRKGALPPVLGDEIKNAKEEAKWSKRAVESYGGKLSKFRQFTDQIHRTVLKSRWAFLTLSTVTAIAVSRIIGSLSTLAMTMLRLPWEAIKRGAKAFYDLGRAVLFTRDRFRQYEVALNGVLQSSTKANQISTFAKQYAAKYPAMYEDIMRTFTLLAQNPQIKPFISTAGTKQLKELMDIVQMLGKLNPEQGVRGAQFAISKAFAGNFRSLMMRFNLPIEVLAGTIGKKRSDLLNPEVLLKALKAYTDLNGGAKLLAESANTLTTHIGNLVDKWKMFLDVVGKTGSYQAALNFFSKLDTVWGKFLKSDVGKKIGAMLDAAIQKVFAFGQALLSFFPSGVFTNIQKFKAALSNAMDFLDTSLQKASSIFEDLFAGLSKTLVPLAASLGMMVAKAFIAGTIKGFMPGQIKTKIKASDIGPAIPDFSKPATPYKDMFSLFGTRLKTNVLPPFKQLMALFQGGGKIVQSYGRQTTALDTYIERLHKTTTALKKLESVGQGKSAEAYRLKRQQQILSEIVRQAHEATKFLTPTETTKVTESLVKQIREKFAKQNIPIRLSMAVEEPNTKQVKNIWSSLQKHVNLGERGAQKQFETMFKKLISNAGAIIKSQATYITAKGLLEPKKLLHTEAWKNAFAILTGIAHPIPAMAAKFKLFAQGLQTLPSTFNQIKTAGMTSYFERLTNKIQALTDKLKGMAQRLDNLKMQKWLAGLSMQMPGILQMQAQLAKATGQPFNLADKLFGLGKRITNRTWAATTEEGRAGYLTQGLGIFKQAFSAAMSTHQITLAQDIFRQIKFVTLDLADLKKRTLSTVIDKLTNKIGSLTSSTQTLNGTLLDLIGNLRDSADKFKVPYKISSSTIDAAQNLLATSTKLGW